MPALREGAGRPADLTPDSDESRIPHRPFQDRFRIAPCAPMTALSRTCNAHHIHRPQASVLRRPRLSLLLLPPEHSAPRAPRARRTCRGRFSVAEGPGYQQPSPPLAADPADPTGPANRSRAALAFQSRVQFYCCSLLSRPLVVSSWPCTEGLGVRRGSRGSHKDSSQRRACAGEGWMHRGQGRGAGPGAGCRAEVSLAGAQGRPRRLPSLGWNGWV